MKRGNKIALIAGSAVFISLISSIVYYRNTLNNNKELVLSANSDYSLELVNHERQVKGLNTLNWNDKLEEAAGRKANDIFAENYFDHTSPSGEKAWNFIIESGYSYRTAGENLAVDFDSVDQAFVAWKNSPSHYSNITSSKYTDYALVQKEGILDGSKTIVYVQLFATK